jgi:hypothetical protein
MDEELEQAVRTLDGLRRTIEESYRESQETGDTRRMDMAVQRFRVRSHAIQSSQPQAYAEWCKGNARFLRAIEEGRNPILC